MPAPIRVLIVDDSAVMRMVLARVLGREPGIAVVGMASNGLEALDADARLGPDVVTLDVEMPELDGLATLDRLLARRPTRVIMLSRATKAGADITIEALRRGAVDALAKPETAWSSGPSAFADELLAKIQASALVPLDRIGPAAPSHPRANSRASPSREASRPWPMPSTSKRPAANSRLVVIATSTGGPRALEMVLRGLPEHPGAGFIVVQHMLTGFTASLSERLDRAGSLRVRELRQGDRVADDLVLVAPGDTHVVVDGAGTIELVTSALVNGVRPAADVTLLAAAPAWRSRLLSVVLTGMGHDGTNGSRAVRAHGGFVIAQDEATSAVFGMPRSVAEADLADRVLPLDRIAEAIVAWARGADSVAGAAYLLKTRATTDT